MVLVLVLSFLCNCLDQFWKCKSRSCSRNASCLVHDRCFLDHPLTFTCLVSRNASRNKKTKKKVKFDFEHFNLCWNLTACWHQLYVVITISLLMHQIYTLLGQFPNLYSWASSLLVGDVQDIGNFTIVSDSEVQVRHDLAYWPVQGTVMPESNWSVHHMAPDQGMHTIKLFISVFFANPNDGASCTISSTILNRFSQLVLAIFKSERQCDMGTLIVW